MGYSVIIEYLLFPACILNFYLYSYAKLKHLYLFNVVVCSRSCGMEHVALAAILIRPTVGSSCNNDTVIPLPDKN